VFNESGGAEVAWRIKFRERLFFLVVPLLKFSAASSGEFQGVELQQWRWGSLTDRSTK
jgi:hypothetical protein